MSDAILTDKRFHDDDAAREHLEALRWPDGAVCPHCGGADRQSKLEGESHRPGLYFCGHCRKQYTVTVGTVFERSKIPLHKWVLATHLICSSKKGMSAHQLHRTLGVTYKTAWFMTHRIREAMNVEVSGPLGSDGGPVEVDETYWGNTDKNNGKRGYAHKMKIVSLVERNGEKRSYHVANVTAKTVTPILRKQMSEKARLMTDESSVYTKVGREFAQHGVVNHSAGEYANGDKTTNTVESSFAILKRGLYGTFHHVSEKHLQRYATEFDFRWNTRAKLGFSDTDRANAALKGITGKRLTYRRTHSFL
ncbi:MAG: IS1595 family transposase [Gammaproteobacteria bacterium]|nr:IS1595 family transposase [Gammaproteobacteria bacterium]